MMRARVTIEVWISDNPAQRAEGQLLLDDDFMAQQISIAGSALQRGTYEIFEAVVKQLQTMEPVPAPKKRKKK